MSKSAFGVDHGGEVAKAFDVKKPMGFVKQVGQAYTQGAKMLGGMAGGGVQRAGMNMVRGGDARGGRIGGAQSKLGMGVKRAGQGMQNRPGMTGAGIAGATAVPGAAAMKINRNKQQPQQPRRF